MTMTMTAQAETTETLSIAPVSLSSCDILLSGELFVAGVPLSINHRVELQIPHAFEVANLLGTLFSHAGRPETLPDDFIDEFRRDLISVHMRLSQGERSALVDRKNLIDLVKKKFPEIARVTWADESCADLFTRDIGNLSQIRSSRNSGPRLPRICDSLGAFRSAVNVLISAVPVLKAVNRDFWAREILDHASDLVREGKGNFAPEILEIAKSLYNGVYDWESKFSISPPTSASPSPRTVESIISDLRDRREARMRQRVREAAPQPRLPRVARPEKVENSVSTKYHSFPASSGASESENRIRQLDEWEERVLADLRELENS